MNFHLKGLTAKETEIVRQCLQAASDGPFIPDWEFHTLFGVERKYIGDILKAWPKIDEESSDTRLAINNSFNNLLHYPHKKWDKWPGFISAPPEEVEQIFSKWRGGNYPNHTSILQTLPSLIRAGLRKFFLVFSTGLIFWLVSEGLFYGLPRSTDSTAGYMITGAIYCYSAWLFLIVVSYFNIKNLPALFLAGGFFGWMVEGVLVNTMYGIPDTPFPLSIPITGLSWHALLTVMVGLYATRTALKKTASTFRLAAFIGVFWGLWASTWRTADPTIQVSPESFFSYSFTLTFLFVLGHLIWQRRVRGGWRFGGKWEIRVAVTLTSLWFVFVTVAQRPMAIFVLPPLLALIYFALKKNKQRLKWGNMLNKLADNIPATRYLAFLIVPFIASGIYENTVGIPNFEYFLVGIIYGTGVIGAIAFITCLIKLHKKEQSQ